MLIAGTTIKINVTGTIGSPPISDSCLILVKIEINDLESKRNVLKLQREYISV
jgi:hypothetical protein